MNEKELGKVRLDKWLWAARVYKTRSQAAQACQAGRVQVDDRRAKPAHQVRPGELIRARVGRLTRTVRVLGLLERRVSAKEVPQYAEDLTPPEEYRRLREEKRLKPLFHRPKGKGRPTKRDRRLLDKLGF